MGDCVRRLTSERVSSHPPWRRGSPLAEKVVQKPIALPLHERREVPSLPSKPFFIEIEALVRPFAIDLHQPLDRRRVELQMEEKSVGILVGEGLIRTQRGRRQERRAARQIKRIAVPLQNRHVPIESAEETMRRTFRCQLNGVIADLFRRLRVDRLGYTRAPSA